MAKETTNEIIKLRSILRDANKQFDEGYITKVEFKKIILEVYNKYKEIVEKEDEKSLSIVKIIFSYFYNPN